MHKAVIFDLFGVFCPDITMDWFKQTVPDYETKLSDFRAICTKSDYGKLSRQDFYEEVSALAGIEASSMKSGVEARIVIDKMLARYVTGLHEQNYKTACMSNGTHEWTRRMITEHGLADLFDEIVVSGDLGIAKPNPGIYIHTLGKLGVSPHEAVFVDDRQVNVDGALDVGIQSLLFTGTQQFIDDFENLVGGS